MEKAPLGLPSKNERWVALLGRPDLPTDGVEEYCHYLKGALAPHGFSLELVRVPWFERGWQAALSELRRRAAGWRGAWVFLQYTALSWSRRGFPVGMMPVLWELRRSGARVAAVFHDAEPYGGDRAIDWLRRRMQLHVMRTMLRVADFAVITIPAERISWLPAAEYPKAVFIPVGANLPSPEREWGRKADSTNQVLTVAVFTVTGDASEDRARESEVECIARTVRYAAERVGELRLALLGRNSENAEKVLREQIGDAPVEIEVYGLLGSEDVVHVLSASDVLLYVRGPISTGRGSAMAGIACGLPVVAWEGWETAHPITEAGVELVPDGSKEEFGPALARVLSDKAYRESLAERSRRAREKYFSWGVIGAKYIEATRANSGKH